MEIVAHVGLFDRKSSRGANYPSSGPNSVSTPLGTPGGTHKPGMSPISPMPDSVGGPRSHHGPGSNHGHDMASPAAPRSNNPSSVNPPASSSSSHNTSLGGGGGGGSKTGGAASAADDEDRESAPPRLPEADSLLLTLMLSDTLLNVYRDHNFESCTLCVCSNEGNVRGRDAGVYLPLDKGGKDGKDGKGGDQEDVSCSCGFSAVVNRRLAHQSGLFYEDEAEVTSITEDLYFRKKPSLLMLDPKGHHGADDDGSGPSFAEKANEVDTIPPSLLQVIHAQSTFFWAGQNALAKYTDQYLKTAVPPAGVSMVELMDGNEVTFSAIDNVRKVTKSKNAGDESDTNAVSKLDEALKATCMHKWSLLPAQGPLCSEDIIRVMKCLQPHLNRSLHARNKRAAAAASSSSKGGKSSGGAASSGANLSVQGPLTWRQFHRMAGPATKGNTDDHSEPLPVPPVRVGHERDALTLSPLALHFWESLNLEPFSQPRDVVYIVVAPDNEFLRDSVKSFFASLSNTYQQCRLGRHVPYSKVVPHGILKVGKLAANKIANGETERWFDLIGDFPTAALLKLYSQVSIEFFMVL